MKRYFEFKDGKSAKFWEIQLAASTLTTRYGKIGALGQNWIKDFDTEEKAHAELEKLVKEKLDKGYVEVSTDGTEEIKTMVTEPTQQNRYFELKGRKANQFIEISINGKTLTRREGDIGCVGESHVFERKNLVEAQCDYDKLLQVLLGQGYKETTPPAPKVYEPETAYFEHPEQNYFFEVSEDDNHLLIRRGMMGKPCMVFNVSYITPNRGRANFERLIKKWKKKGFVQTKPSIPIIEGSVAGELFADEIEDHPVYSRFFDLGWANELRGQGERIFHFRNGLTYDGNLDLEEIADMELEAGLIIEGDVRVSGVFSQLSYTYPTSILITGSVYAQSLGHKDSHMRIDGDVRVDNIVYGEYNDGSLQIGGDVYGTAWISGDHDMWAAGTYHLPKFSWGETDGLSPKLLDLEGRLDWDALREFIRAGKNPLRKDFVFGERESEPIEEIPAESELMQKIRVLAADEDTEGMVDLLEDWPEHDEEWSEFVQDRLNATTTTVDQRTRLLKLINGADFTDADSEPNQNSEHTEEIVHHEEVLHKLIELEDSGADFESPEVKNWLENITEITVMSESLKRIPSSIGKLVNLKSLTLVFLTLKNKTLPDSLGNLSNLEELILADIKLKQVPTTLSNLTQLKKLSLKWNKQLTHIPPIPSLECLLLDDNSTLEPFDLALMPKLKTLWLNGLKALPTGFEHLLELETLSLMSCRLQQLPEEIFALPKLNEILLDGNPKLDVGQIDRLGERAVLPRRTKPVETQGEEEAPKRKKSTRTRQALKDVKQLNQQGSNLQQSNPAEALLSYQQVLDRCAEFLLDFPDDFAYEHLFALQGKLWCLNVLVEQHQPERQDEAETVANEILEFTAKQFNFYYSEAGNLSRAAQTLAHNTLAWYSLFRARNLIKLGEPATAILKEALEHVNAAVAEIDYNADENTYAVVLETKVEILLALGRSDEAFVVVYQIHRKFPELPYFAQITQSSEYQLWDQEN